MQNEIQPEPSEPPQTTVTEADAQACQRDSLHYAKIIKAAERALRQRLRLTILATSLCMTAPCFGLFFSKGYDVQLLPLCLLPSVGIYALLSSMMRHWPGEEQILSGADLARVGGVQAIPALFAASRADAPILQIRASRAALTLLLPRMKAKDAYLLTGEARRTIQKWLKGISDYPTNSEDFDALRISALKALCEVGDFYDIPVVTQLTEMPTRATSEEALKQAAIECLTALKARDSREEAKRTLLRASQAGEARPDTLLRPANGAGNTDAAELLRGSGASNKQE